MWSHPIWGQVESFKISASRVLFIQSVQQSDRKLILQVVYYQVSRLRRTLGFNRSSKRRWGMIKCLVAFTAKCSCDAQRSLPFDLLSPPPSQPSCLMRLRGWFVKQPGCSGCRALKADEQDFRSRRKWGQDLEIKVPCCCLSQWPQSSQWNPPSVCSRYSLEWLASLCPEQHVGLMQRRLHLRRSTSPKYHFYRCSSGVTWTQCSAFHRSPRGKIIHIRSQTLLWCQGSIL